MSNNADEKTSLDIKEDMTFYSAVISHSYYCIFYAAKAILMSKNIKTSTPEVHKKNIRGIQESFCRFRYS
ncbi:MAG: HEPN domain-containing protein [Candidatus Aenigmarchaeota archaeon]|nr:HEPN domain-containing protein [Candidatus Aenigmarchaeota archaeon]